jgi:hypothetical protein
MKNAQQLTTTCLEMSNNNINFATKIVKTYTQAIHDLFEERTYLTDKMKENLLLTANSDWWLSKLQNDIKKKNDEPDLNIEPVFEDSIETKEEEPEERRVYCECGYEGKRIMTKEEAEEFECDNCVLNELNELMETDSESDSE